MGQIPPLGQNTSIPLLPGMWPDDLQQISIKDLFSARDNHLAPGTTLCLGAAPVPHQGRGTKAWPFELKLGHL